MTRLNYTKKNGRLKRNLNNKIETMSYSRWLNSKFYTYWCGSDAQHKEDELFNCHTTIERYYGFTYTECKELVKNIIKIKGRINEIEGDEDAIELQGYMKQFITSVDSQYEKD